MSLLLDDPQTEISRITDFLKKIITDTNKQHLVVAVSGGIDSAVVLSLAVRSIGVGQVTALLLPYHEQSVEDSQLIADWNHISQKNRITQNIGGMVDLIADELQARDDQTRMGNIMARVRMISVYDLAKKLDALVCGTENKSEKYLGYFTRFGDEASDIEPIQHLYKTQVRQLAEALALPSHYLAKPPSAGLWTDQTDEQELGFGYEDADKVIAELLKEGNFDEVNLELKKRVKQRVESQEFKHHVPYILK